MDPVPRPERALERSVARLGPGSGPLSLADQAYQALSELLLTLRIPPGAPMPEERLCAELELGRTPIREALKRLEAERLVVVHPRRGTFASEVHLADHVLIADVRRPLEALAARRAAERATPSERHALAEHLERLRAPLEPQDLDGLIALDSVIHASVAEAAHNQHLASTLRQYYNLSLRIWYLFLERLPGMEEHVRSHAPLLEAILAPDPQAAAQAAALHVEDFESAISRLLAPSA